MFPLSKEWLALIGIIILLGVYGAYSYNRGSQAVKTQIAADKITNKGKANAVERKVRSMPANAVNQQLLEWARD